MDWGAANTTLKVENRFSGKASVTSSPTAYCRDDQRHRVKLGGSLPTRRVETVCPPFKPNGTMSLGTPPSVHDQEHHSHPPRLTFHHISHGLHLGPLTDVLVSSCTTDNLTMPHRKATAGSRAPDAPPLPPKDTRTEIGWTDELIPTTLRLGTNVLGLALPFPFDQQDEAVSGTLTSAYTNE
jgi:hypothetical protein